MEHEELAKIIGEHAYLERLPPEPPFTLASGRQSRHYFDLERATSRAEALPLIGRAVYDLLRDEVVCVGGPTRGADPIATAVAYHSALAGRPVNTFSVRRAPKTHGIPGSLEGSARPGDAVAFVDDVVTSGGSVIDAIRQCLQEELRVVQVIILVDREEGGLERIRQEFPQLPVTALFTYRGILETRGRGTAAGNRDLASSA